MRGRPRCRPPRARSRSAPDSTHNGPPFSLQRVCLLTCTAVCCVPCMVGAANFEQGCDHGELHTPDPVTRRCCRMPPPPHTPSFQPPSSSIGSCFTGNITRGLTRGHALQGGQRVALAGSVRSRRTPAVLCLPRRPATCTHMPGASVFCVHTRHSSCARARARASAGLQCGTGTTPL